MSVTPRGMKAVERIVTYALRMLKRRGMSIAHAHTLVERAWYTDKTLVKVEATRRAIDREDWVLADILIADLERDVRDDSILAGLRADRYFARVDQILS
jgi:hypothetical protein